MIRKMSLKSRRELLESIRARYNQAMWSQKCQIIDGFVAATGYQRKYAIHLINKKEEQPRLRNRRPPQLYNEPVRQVLTTVWEASNRICSKRLVPFLPHLVESLERHGHLSMPPDIRSLLLNISAATVDRLLKPERKSNQKGISTTKAGPLLKKRIKVRTFTEWNDVRPGFLEGDLVAHCGGNVQGTFLNTLVLTDIVSGWTEFVPLLRRSSADVLKGIELVEELLPFSILGIDTDNGNEFINHDLIDYCDEHKITFTRSRPYRKNDQAHVEEKNGSIVRRLVGYDRFEGRPALEVLTKLYSVLRLYVNFFQPSLKLVSKTRERSRIKKKYDVAQTPFQRLLRSGRLSVESERQLRMQYERLDPILLQKKMKMLQEKFWSYAWTSEKQIEVEPGDTQNLESRRNELVTPSLFSGIRRYRRTKKPRKKLGPRTYRTRKDPFEHAWSGIRFKLELNHHQTAKELLEKLIKTHPGQYKSKSLRTLQRRVAEWRRSQAGHEKKLRETMLQSKFSPVDSESVDLLTDSLR